MRKHIYSAITLISLMLSASLMAMAQNTGTVQGITPPDWVKAMEDPNANYFKTVKAYKDFWKGREKPADEDELKERSRKAPAPAAPLSEKEMQEQRIENYYRYQCKRFENWMRENKAYVQKDGHILTADERLKLWEQTKKERK